MIRTHADRVQPGRLDVPAVALVGNPNTGKTTLFNALAGMRQHVGNYPGVTVELKKGHFRIGESWFHLVDLPGTYSLAPRSPDEMVAVDLVLGNQPGERRPDVLVSIVDASNLERNLYLTTQLLELGLPIVVALNMIDVAQRQGRTIDVAALECRLGLRVVPIQANKKVGLEALKAAIAEAVGSPAPAGRPTFPDALEAELQALRQLGECVRVPLADFLLRRALLDAGGSAEGRLVAQWGPSAAEHLAQARRRLADAGCPVPAAEIKARYAWIRQATEGCVARTAPRVNWSERFDRVFTHRLWGLLIFLLLMAVVFQSIFTGARPLMEAIQIGQSWLGDAIQANMDAGPLRSLLVGGVINGVGSVVVFLPQIVILFGFIALLEDCGYMARAAFLMDKLMARCGLSGKSFIPLLSSFACAIPGIMAARVIEDRRDRLATILTAPLMSCSARLPVYTILISAFLTEGRPWWLPGVTLFAMYLIGIAAAPAVALVLKRTLLRGETPIFLLELPPYKRPAPGQVLFRMYDRGVAFLRRAGTLILASMIVVWALLYFPHTGRDADGREIDYDREIDRRQQDISAEERALYWRLRQTAELEGSSEVGGCTLAAERRGQIEDRLLPIQAKFEEIHRLQGEWKRGSLLGRAGQAIEPAVAPLGWNWKIGMAAIASFPAREVVVGTLGIIYDVGAEVEDDTRALESQLLAARWEEGSPRAGQPVFTIPVALSLMVFFALCCQCVSTLAVIRRETNSWRWPFFTFVYMTALAYLGALAVYQVGSQLP